MVLQSLRENLLHFYFLATVDLNVQCRKARVLDLFSLHWFSLVRSSYTPLWRHFIKIPFFSLDITVTRIDGFFPFWCLTPHSADAFPYA